MRYDVYLCQPIRPLCVIDALGVRKMLGSHGGGVKDRTGKEDGGGQWRGPRAVVGHGTYQRNGENGRKIVVTLCHTDNWQTCKTL